jgi:hypothetical protein
LRGDPLAVGEGVGPLAGLATAASPGSASMPSKICQNACLTSAWAWVGTPGQEIPGVVGQAPLAQAVGEDQLDPTDKPGRAGAGCLTW